MRQGIKTSTWRIFDDKKLSRGNRIKLIDKVDASNRASWKEFSEAEITRVIEKPLGEITKSDFEGHETYQSPAAMLEMYRQYYGPEVTLATKVKIVHFKLVE